MSIGIIKKAGVTPHRQITCTARCGPLTLLAWARQGKCTAGKMYISLGNIRHLIATMHFRSKKINA